MCAGMWVDRPLEPQACPSTLSGHLCLPWGRAWHHLWKYRMQLWAMLCTGSCLGCSRHPYFPTSLCWTQGFTSSTEGTEGVAPRPRPSQEITALSTRDHFNSLLNPLGCRQWNFPGPQGYLPTTCPACCRTGCQQPFPSERGDVTRPQSCYDQFSSRPQAWLFLLALPR